jgi:hypothetical protein
MKTSPTVGQYRYGRVETERRDAEISPFFAQGDVSKNRKKYQTQADQGQVDGPELMAFQLSDMVWL